jgi:preprotein translocase subunit Sec61beta
MSRTEAPAMIAGACALVAGLLEAAQQLVAALH